MIGKRPGGQEGRHRRRQVIGPFQGQARQPELKVQPGDVYIDYLGDATFGQSGKPYCLPCSAVCIPACWLKKAWPLMVRLNRRQSK